MALSRVESGGRHPDITQFQVLGALDGAACRLLWDNGMLPKPVPVLVAVTCTALLGLLGGSALPLTAWRAWAAIGALGVAGLCFGAVSLHRARRPTRWVALSLTLSAGAAGVALAPQPDTAGALPPAGMARLLVVVREVRFGEGDSAVSRVSVLSGTRLADGAVVPAPMELWVQPWALPEGATVKLVGTITPSVGFRNPSPHPTLPSPHTVRGHVTLPSRDAFRVVTHSLPARVMYALRSHVRARLQQTLDRDGASVACALVLGDPDSLDDDDATSVRASGMAHVFAVSGMHVTLLAGMAMLALTSLFVRIQRIAARFDTRRLAAAAGVPMALFIAAFTGGAPSGVRAAVTTAIAWTLVACNRRPHAGAVTAFATLLLVGIEPANALRPAFLLSIAATAAIVAAPRATPQTTTELIFAVCALSVRASLATAPIVLWTFGTLAIAGVAANLVLLPLGSALLGLSAAHALLASLAPPLCAPTAWLVSTGSRAFLVACRAFAEQGPAVSWPVLDVWQGITLASATVLVLFCSSLRSRLIGVCVTLVLLGALELRLRWAERPQGVLRVTFVDVGQGDAALIDLPDGRAMLIDAGGNPQGGADPGERALVPLLRARRRARVDIVVLSHPHPDHYGGLQAVLDAVPVGELWDTGQAHAEAQLEGTSAAAAQLVDTARARGARIRSPAALCGSPQAFGGAVIQVLWPCPSYDPDYDPNDNSLVLRIAYGRRSFLFTGDIEEHAEDMLTSSHALLHADVLKVPHHGSHTSSSEALLRAVSPSLAIISAGAVNRFGHPHADVVQRLQARVREVVDLGRRGGTIVITDGNDLRYQTWADGWATASPALARPAPQESARRCVPAHIRPATASFAPSDETAASTVNGVAQNK